MKIITTTAALTSLFVLNACNEPTAKTAKESPETEQNKKVAQTKTLQQQLKDRSAEAAAKGNPAVRAEFAKGIEAVKATDILDRALKTGDKAPDFTLSDANGKQVSLSNLLKNGPVVLTWYRGGWCPYCNITLRALQQELPNFKAEGAQLVALTPELPDKSLNTLEKNQLEFSVLTDLNHQVAKEFQIIFQLTPKVAELYKQKFDLTKFNGSEAGDKDLPLAATYIIGTDGIIKWHYLDADYRQRAEPSVITDQLKKL